MTTKYWLETRGKSMDAKGKVIIKFEINEQKYMHTFIVCDSLTRQIIVGHDFLIRNRMSLGWDNDENNKPIKEPVQNQSKGSRTQ